MGLMREDLACVSWRYLFSLGVMLSVSVYSTVFVCCRLYYIVHVKLFSAVKRGYMTNLQLFFHKRLHLADVQGHNLGIKMETM